MWQQGIRVAGAGPCLALLLAVPPGSQAEDAEPLATLPRLTIIGTTPLPGAGVEPDRVSAVTQVIDAADIGRTGIPNLTGALLSNVPSATLNDTEGNVFQPDILFRGFTASPVAGTPQGLAVYVNGARFNDAFGDTVNWDLIPPVAIQSVNLEAANPLFGLNALGGSLDIRLKNGFTAQTGSVTAYGGSYGRASLITEYGHQFGDFAFYVAADATHDTGFRQTSTSNLTRILTDLGWRNEAAEVHLALTGAHDTLGNPGATPVQSLAVDYSSIFTAPNEVENKYFSANLNGNLRLADHVTAQGLVYYQRFQQTVPNGITEELEPCNDGTGLLCNSDGTAVTGPNNTPVTDFLNGATYSGLSIQQLGSHAYGAAAQLADDAALGTLKNHFVAGVSVDDSDSTFAGVQLIGGFDAYSREFIGPGVVQDQPSEGVNPVRVRSLTHFYGVFATDTLTVLPDLDLNLAARYNHAGISLEDELAGPVNGQHAYSRVNPSAGITWNAAAGLQVFARYAETNRAPTPQELSCASPAAPCSLLNFFVGDPNLDQVVTHTVEAGIRGQAAAADRGQLRWDVDVYHTVNTNDIIYESTVYNPNLAYYTNAGRTQRQGFEASLRYAVPGLRLTLGYALTEATFQSPLVLNSGNNPEADANGQEQVVPGDRIPGIPRHRVNLVVDYDPLPSWTIGVTAIAQGSSFRFGDEANLTAPLGGYTVVDLDTSVRIGERLTLFALVNNVLDRHFYTYGSFGPVGDVPWPNVPGGVTDPRTASPGQPRVVYGGLRLSF
jgi:outer membrane receptor protein involved in Fe transport